jgi:hypothetical protein
MLTLVFAAGIILASPTADSPPCDEAAGIVTDCVQMQSPEEVLGRAIDCPDGTVGYVVDVNGGTSCASVAAPAPAPAPAQAPAPAPAPLRLAAAPPLRLRTPSTCRTAPRSPCLRPSLTPSPSPTSLRSLRDLFGGFLGSPPPLLTAYRRR